MALRRVYPSEMLNIHSNERVEEPALCRDKLA